MSWPLSQDYNEAIQDPRNSFSDAELKTGEAVANALGIPMPRSGNFADVYEVRCPSGSRWAVKCFTREVPGLRERYASISRHLQNANLPFTVDFTFLEHGVRVGGRWYPVLKMQWVEGLTLNEFVRQYADKPAMLKTLLQIWVRMAARLREAGIAHADLQHGNVLLVPSGTGSSLAVKLVDYDGMFVPALANKKSSEVGHCCYQHPQRLAEGTYSLEVDRFPLLLVATALDGLRVGGRAMWDKYDNSDNLLFRKEDLQAPVKSRLFYELLKLSDERATRLARQTLDALKGRLESTPLLEEVLPELHTPAAPKPAAAPATPKRTTVVKSAAVQPAAEIPAANPTWDFDSDEKRRSRRRLKAGLLRWVGCVAAVCVAGLVLAGGIVALGLRNESRKPNDINPIAQNKPETPPRPRDESLNKDDSKEKQPDENGRQSNVPEGPTSPGPNAQEPQREGDSPVKETDPKDKELQSDAVPMSSEHAEVLTPAQAAGKVGQKVTVQLHVQQTGSKSEGFLELFSEEACDRAGNSFFLRFPESTHKKFQELDVSDVGRHFYGKLVRVTGTVTTFQLKEVTYSCIVIDDPDQIVVPELPTPRSDGNESPAKIAPPETPNLSTADAFVSLFNGKDLTGWKPYPDDKAMWSVKDGVLIGRGGRGHLFSERGDYENFHFRVEAAINDGGNSGQYFRAQFGDKFPKGYEAQINSTASDALRTGSLIDLGAIVKVSDQLHKPDEWFTQEVIVEGGHIVIKVNDKTVVDKQDKRYKKGHLALQVFDEATVVNFRKIEVKELPAKPDEPSLHSEPRPRRLEPKDVAAKDYEKSCIAARASLLKAFDIALAQLAKRKGSTEARLTMIQIVKEEKERFENRGLIPWSEPMRQFVERYFVVLAAAQGKLSRLYESLIDAQLRKKNASKIEDLRAELKTRLDIRVLARWRYFLNGRGRGLVALCSNGRIGNSEGKATWSYANGVLILRWPDPRAPKGAWVDSLHVSVDGTTMSGTNNDRPERRPTLTGTYLK
ncbi:MAG TPA: family 16 glycoside hydrolase [Gemmataceae bacterium]|nr:family 16 glycoside hydrolase [Gemmataceae bacterium]